MAVRGGKGGCAKNSSLGFIYAWLEFIPTLAPGILLHWPFAHWTRVQVRCPRQATDGCEE